MFKQIFSLFLMSVVLMVSPSCSQAVHQMAMDPLLTTSFGNRVGVKIDDYSPNKTCKVSTKKSHIVLKGKGVLNISLNDVCQRKTLEHRTFLKFNYYSLLSHLGMEKGSKVKFHLSNGEVIVLDNIFDVFEKTKVVIGKDPEGHDRFDLDYKGLKFEKKVFPIYVPVYGENFSMLISLDDLEKINISETVVIELEGVSNKEEGDFHEKVFENFRLFEKKLKEVNQKREELSPKV
jgi:hypothetical protein